MANYSLGQLGLNPRGAYNASTAYARLDTVTYNGNSYVALTVTTGIAPTNTEKWMLLAQSVNNEPAWNYVTLGRGTTPGSYGAGRMRYMKVGNHVYVVGSVNVTPGSNITLFTLPSGYRPTSGTATVIKPCSGTRIARIAITTDGSFNLEWVKNLTNGSNYTSASIWVECSIDFWIAGA